MASYSDQPAQPYQSGPPVGQGEDPGKTLGIVGLVLAFLVSLVGLIISIVARSKSKKAGYKNGVALAGIIVGLVITLFWLGIGGFAGVAGYKVYEKCKDLGPGVHQQNGVTYTCS